MLFRAAGNLRHLAAAVRPEKAHFLRYADAQTEDRYQWFETASTATPLRATTKTLGPFVLGPHHESRAAAGPGTATHQPARPLVPLVAACPNVPSQGSWRR
ncbi:hypothetical protein GCM10010415_66500 [Streptomyces atrovirens]